MKPLVPLLLFMSSLLAAQPNTITIYHKVNTNKSVDIFYKKNVPGTYTIYLDFINLSNTFSKSITTSVSGYGGILKTLKPLNQLKPILFKYKYSYVLGHYKSKPDSLFTYTVPLKKNTSFYCIELDYLGEQYFDSKQPKNWKAYQFITSANDTVFAARKGIVIKVENNFKTDSLHYYYNSNKNDILIEHTDGTIASYSNFKYQKNFVNLGDMVYPQTPIGIANSQNNVATVEFKLYFLSNPIFNTQNHTFKTIANQHQFITPYFLTKNGKVQLNPKQHYRADFNTTILYAELTKKELNKINRNEKN